MDYKEFEDWVSQYLEKRFPDHEIWAANSKEAWRQDVLGRYYRFAESFGIPRKEFLSKSIFALWFIGGQRRGIRMTKSTRWDVGGNIIFHHPHEMNFASIYVIDEASKQISVRTLNEKQLIEMQSAIREILSEFPKDP